MTTTKQEFILNNITEMVRAGRVTGLVDLAEQLAAVYDVSSVTPRIEVVMNPSAGELVQEPLRTDRESKEPTLVPTEATEPTPLTVDEAAVADLDDPIAMSAANDTPPPAPADDALRTHDDWGIAFSDEWNVSTRSTVAGGQFKRKPGTNEQDYAIWLQQQVIAAQQAGTFTGPDNWAAVARVSKYIDPVATPEPDAAPVETLQPQAATVGQAVHETVTAPQPEPAPKEFDEVRETVAAATTASTGASAASEVPSTQQMMPMHMNVCKAFGATDSRAKCVLDALGVANILQITDDAKKVWFMNASQAVLDQLDTIKSDNSGEMLKMVLDNVQ